MGSCLELFLLILIFLIIFLVLIKFLLSLKCYSLELFLLILVFLVIKLILLIFLKVLLGLFLSLKGSSLKLFLLILVKFLFLIFFLIFLSLIDLSLLVKVLYRLLSGLDLLSIGLTAGEEAAQREGGGAGHGDQQEGQEVSHHLHGVAGVVSLAIVSSGSDQAQLI